MKLVQTYATYLVNGVARAIKLTVKPLSTVQGQMRRLDLTNNKITPRQFMTLVKAVEDLALVGVVVF